MPGDQPSSPAEDQSIVKTILVVEDDSDIGAFIVEALKQETSYQAMLVTDGFQALKAVSSLKPSLFLLDNGLPSMNGIELYDKMHAIKELEDIPAILISAHLPTREAQKRGITCIRKPFDLDELLQAIEKLL